MGKEDQQVRKFQECGQARTATGFQLKTAFGGCRTGTEQEKEAVLARPSGLRDSLICTPKTQTNLQAGTEDGHGKVGEVPCFKA